MAALRLAAVGLPAIALGGRPAEIALNTWSIVVADPTTGDVGVAGASCVPASVEALAVLVPGHGAAAVQALFDKENRDFVRALLEQGRSADAVVGAVTDRARDTGVSQRQYGAVTLGPAEPRTAAFTGDAVEAHAGERSDARELVAVQGNYLEGEAVLEATMSAYLDPRLTDAAIPDRLMHALEAGSAAGGDARCNDGGPGQTALSAFVLYARGDQAPFSVAEFGADGRHDPDAPWLYVSVTEGHYGPNPLVGLRRAYDAWRAENLSDCEACRTLRIQVPPGNAAVKEEAPDEAPNASGAGALGAALAGLAAGAAVLFMARRRESR